MRHKYIEAPGGGKRISAYRLNLTRAPPGRKRPVDIKFDLLKALRGQLAVGFTTEDP